MNQKKVLGRGLGALIPQREAPAPSGLAEIPLSQISPNPYQPRKSFNEASIDELARSVREHGIVQPIVVSRSGEQRYRLIAGERQSPQTCVVAVCGKYDVRQSRSQRSLAASLSSRQRCLTGPVAEGRGSARLPEDRAFPNRILLAWTTSGLRSAPPAA